jgi:hypothetical protein
MMMMMMMMIIINKILSMSYGPIESLAHDSGHTSVCDEYAYPKGSPNTNS